MKRRALFLGVTAAISAAGLVPLAVPRPAAAQNPVLQNVIPESQSVTLQAKIRSIDANTRQVTLEGASGQAITVTAGPEVRLELLKPGQTVNAKYYRSVGFVVTPPKGGSGVPTSDDQVSQIIAQPMQTPGGVGVRVTKLSGTVVGIDQSSHSINVVNPSGGGVYTIDVTDPARIAMLNSLKVGDTVTAVVSQIVAVSIDPAPQSWL
jgi:Cu/Ag efflux protein CusF